MAGPYIIQNQDVARGYMNVTFEEKNLVASLFNGLGSVLGALTDGTTVYITPIVISNGKEIRGEEQAIEVSEGLLGELLGTLADGGIL